MPLRSRVQAGHGSGRQGLPDVLLWLVRVPALLGLDASTERRSDGQAYVHEVRSQAREERPHGEVLLHYMRRRLRP